jgi:predicted metal-dependent HD superfamily phosphohydrolase
MLKTTFIELVTKYTNDDRLITELWAEIEQKYTVKQRHYHTLTHLQSLLKQLLEIKDKIGNWDPILFTLYYHDIIYDAQKGDNEEKSAELAEIRMKQLSVPDQFIKSCKSQILATKNHQSDHDTDTNYFTDADLSILGQGLEDYTIYYQNIRKEYAVYPYLVYKTGREKVLKHFLMMERIYKTDYFYHKFEHQAKQNLQFELEHL